MDKSNKTKGIPHQQMEESKVVGISIPSNCTNIYIFQNEGDFIAQINSGKMLPLYGNKDYQKEYMELFAAYVP